MVAVKNTNNVVEKETTNLKRSTTEKFNWKFIVFLILGIIPIVVVGFTIPRLCSPLTQPVVYKDLEFTLEQATSDDYIEYEYRLDIELRFNKNIRGLVLSVDFEDDTGTTTKLMSLGSYPKKSEKLMIKFILKDTDYEFKSIKFKIDGQDDFKKLYNADIMTLALVDVTLALMATFLCYTAFKFKSQKDNELEENSSELSDSENEVDVDSCEVDQSIETLEDKDT